MEKHKTVYRDRAARISGIKLKMNGLKGINVKYETAEVEGREHYANEHDDKRQRPVHQEIKALAKQLKPHLLFLCGYAYDVEDDGFEALKMVTEVTGVSARSNQFLIMGKINSFENKEIAINTPLIKMSDAYDDFDPVMSIITKLFAEVDLYMNGEKRATKKEVIVDYAIEVKKNKEFTYELYENMSAEEQIEFMNQMQKDLGMSIISDEDGNATIGDFDDEEEEEEELVLDSGNAVEEKPADKPAKASGKNKKEGKSIPVAVDKEDSEEIDAYIPTGDDEDNFDIN